MRPNDDIHSTDIADSRTSSNYYCFIMQSDGNAVIYDNTTGRPIWTRAVLSFDVLVLAALVNDPVTLVYTFLQRERESEFEFLLWSFLSKYRACAPAGFTVRQLQKKEIYKVRLKRSVRLYRHE